MRGIKSQNDNLGTYETNKISISCFHNKRYIPKNGISTLAYGKRTYKSAQSWQYYKLKQQRSQ